MRRIMFAIVALAGFTAGTLAAEPEKAELPPLRSIPELAQLDEATFKRWTALELPLRIEGRYSAFTPGLVRMAGFDLAFVPKGGAELARPEGRGRTVEFTGRFALRDERRVFVVEKLRALPDDGDVYVARRAAIDPTVPAEWYALGRWALERGRFYEDEELTGSGAGALLSGFALERERVATSDAAVLRRLAERAASLGLPPSVGEELLHEAWLAEWEPARKAKDGSLARLADRLASELPGASAPLPAPQPKLRDEYLADPRRTYSAADAETRPKLHRILYAEVRLEDLRRQVAPDAANGFHIADRIDAWVPEQHELAEALREREIAGELGRLEDLDQSAMLALARKIRLRNEPDRARQTIARWLAFAEERGRREGPAGLVRVADQYRNLLEDEEQQLELLVEAHRASGHAEDIGLRLAELGYRFRGGRWARDEPEPPATQRAPIDAAILEGRVTTGMTPAQVRLAWRAPDTVVRLATAGTVTEIWSFTEPGRPTTAVHFRRGAQQRPEAARAVRVNEVRP
ncbi:MAG: hypothetical protein WED34_21435 [Planctomycetales bacterium]